MALPPALGDSAGPRAAGARRFSAAQWKTSGESNRAAARALHGAPGAPCASRTRLHGCPAERRARARGLAGLEFTARPGPAAPAGETRALPLRQGGGARAGPLASRRASSASPRAARGLAGAGGLGRRRLGNATFRVPVANTRGASDGRRGPGTLALRPAASRGVSCAPPCAERGRCPSRVLCWVPGERNRLGRSPRLPHPPAARVPRPGPAQRPLWLPHEAGTTSAMLHGRKRLGDPGLCPRTRPARGTRTEPVSPDPEA